MAGALRRLWDRALPMARDFLLLNWVRDIFMYLVRIVERMEQNHIFLSAAALSFNALLCFIPLLLLVFWVLGFYLGTDDAIVMVEKSIRQLDLFPYQREQLRNITVGIIREFVQGSKLAGILGGIGLIWTSSALFGALRTVFGRIFHIEDNRNIFASKLRDFAMLSVVGIAMVLITTFMYASSLLRGLGEDVFGLRLHSWVFDGVVNTASVFLLSFFLFIIVFTLVPDKRQRFRVIVIASFVAALLWGIAKAIFAYYLANLWSIGTVYGPYAVIVATAIWVYYSSITLLFAAEVGQMYEERRRLRKLFTEESLHTVVLNAQRNALEFTRGRRDGKAPLDHDQHSAES